ncbi:Gfo/Idh/MocA family oxidoreductase [Streptomyces lunaelactis]|uniref:Gfo/Idh/MocA family oxidoreductase n=1 Tax=Streptomyces lunaelactis TaxID=1535768 RepID=UPI0015853B36|nr:Gfo/Idh/MocA family oxidoreductase [Streptomyces lunaelactis]NUK27717.1 Gfo/Idh/MocA family oxidoreductase [Streptomyces lunaelactis]NUK33844.1 Gfo/Idh/MocA family oxidoreductase [Streptomyces lunaelactis]NUK45877.1 Gfo/Idh/MocA family oxidoreductase [Streptomyces lunaelactis]NUK91123.1 Gfo/Idh/MocA family oxidoreductase [Streptomyces lunaelactis]NUL29881.1 Gfo/Idh/MocA family oxidoreductase [Streptomyces lunaelactis]
MTGTATRTPLRVGLVGYGLAGSVFHAPLIVATEGLALDTIVTSNPERRKQALAEFPGVRFADSPDELWERADELDLIVIASPNKTHVPIATAALEAGLAVVVDKPIAGTAAEARELAALAEERGLPLSVFQNRRWDNDFLTLQKLIADGELGDVQRFESRFERWRPQLKGGWRESGDPQEIGGLLYDLGSHVVDQALTLFGPVVRVYAEADVRRPGAETDDDTFIALTHANGVRSHLYASATTAQLGPRFRVLGSTAGYVKHGLDPQEADLRDGKRPSGSGDDNWGKEPESLWGRVGAGESPLTGGGRPVETLPGDYPAYYAAIATAVREGTAPPVTAHEAAAALDVLEAARRSAREGVTVEVSK